MTSLAGFPVISEALSNPEQSFPSPTHEGWPGRRINQLVEQTDEHQQPLWHQSFFPSGTSTLLETIKVRVIV